MTIQTNYRSYTIEECFESGFRDGRYGIRFYPCTYWELIQGDKVRGDIKAAETAYTEGYKSGRAHWRVFTNCFSALGDTRFDDAIKEEIAAFRALGRYYARIATKELNGDKHPRNDNPADKCENARLWKIEVDRKAERMEAIVKSWGFDHLDFGVGLYPTIQMGKSDSCGTIHFSYSDS
jgi:hypothetical protein